MVHDQSIQLNQFLDDWLGKVATQEECHQHSEGSLVGSNPRLGGQCQDVRSTTQAGLQFPRHPFHSGGLHGLNPQRRT